MGNHFYIEQLVYYYFQYDDADDDSCLIVYAVERMDGAARTTIHHALAT
jgi:hypothetical protein